MTKTAQKSHQTKLKIQFGRWSLPIITTVIVLFLLLASFLRRQAPTPPITETATPSATTKDINNIPLPAPDQRSSNSVEAVLKNRRTRRDFLDKEISLKQVSQLLWAAQGVTVDWGGRTAPSAKSTYPLSIFLVAHKVSGLEPGEYQYIPGDRTPVHQLKPILLTSLREFIYNTLKESSFKSASAIFIITGNMGKMAEAYGGIPHDKEVYLEAGHVAQNLYLQAESLKLGMVVISSFDSAKIQDLVTIPSSDTIIYLVPVGVPKP